MQMAILFAWNKRPTEKINFHSLVLATELSEYELRRTLASLYCTHELTVKETNPTNQNQKPQRYQE